MNLDGFIGEIVFSGDLTGFLPHLGMGELLNVGKDGSFGLGKYEMSFETVPIQGARHEILIRSRPLNVIPASFQRESSPTISVWLAPASRLDPRGLKDP